MATLIYESELNAALEGIIRESESYILLMCPYLKLHDRLKDCLKHHKNNPDVQIIVIFGKNEEDPSKSLHREDFEFLKSFPNVTVCYERRLHAKYFANEKCGLVTSINLHSFSMNNNIEVGVYFKTKSTLKNITDKALNPLTSIISETENIAAESDEFFKNVYNNAERIFVKHPNFESKMFGIQKKYIGSEIKIDNSDKLFQNIKRGDENNYSNQQNTKISSGGNNYYSTFNSNHNNEIPFHEKGFCIRTREKIAYDPSRPLSRDSYFVWAEFSNPDYRERYCHCCGKEYPTSVRNPICNECS
jgi:hypothetical protein